MKHFKLYIKIFSLIILIILSLPCFFINQENNSEFENRKLAKFPKYTTKEGKFNYSIGKDFEAYLKDRFWLREFYIQLYCDIKYYFPAGYYKLGNIFYNKKYHYATNKYSISRFELIAYSYELDDIIKNIKILKEFCDKNNIKLYLINPPDKNDIGSKYSYPQKTQKKECDEYKKMIDYIKAESNVDIIYPYEELSKMQYYESEPAYYKMDDHWTQKAAHLVYLQLMDRIKKDFKNVKAYELKDLSTYTSNMTNYNPIQGFFPGKYYNRLRLHDDSILDTQYTYIIPYGNILQRHESNIDKCYNTNFYLNKSNKDAPNIFIFGDSFALNLLPGIVSSFKNTYDIFTYAEGDVSESDSAKIKRFEKTIINNKTDILVVCFVRLIKFRYLYNTD